MDGGNEHARREALQRRETLRACRQLLLRSGLFDADWYRAHVPAAAESDLDPLDHYIAHGVGLVAPPGPLFDPDDYLRRTWHLRRGVDDPLQHFLQHGDAEARSARSLPASDASSPVPGRVVQALQLPSSCPRQPTLAVVVHAFHPELFDEICDALRFLPYRFSLLVTVTAPEHESLIHETVRRHGLDAMLLVRLAANRGRNVGPMLLCFREAIRAHELVLHLHTKRSLYHPGGLDGWRRSLLRTLLPARAVVRGLIALFDQDPALGVLTPSPSPEVRYWSYNWLRNRSLAQPLFDRLGLGCAPPRGMFDFPAGGMFWARTRAIAALLDHPWREDDFPPEQGQTDGTIMHAIERSIVSIAADAGYGFREIDADRGVMRPGWGSRNLAAYPEIGAEALTREIEAAGVVSFDVFDTLLTRICLSPDAVHRFVGFVAERGFPGAAGFASLRRQAEAAARADRTGDGEVDLDEIAARFASDARQGGASQGGASQGGTQPGAIGPDCTGPSGTTTSTTGADATEPGATGRGSLPSGPGWSEEAIRFAFDQEVALDLRALRPRRVLLEALRTARAAGRRTILVSDSYLTRPLFDAMLHRFDLDAQVDRIYLSSEQRARKDRGDLWRLVGQAEPAGLLHVGDNEQSDIQATADAGMRHTHVMSPATLFQLHGLLPAGCEDDLGADILLGPVAERLFNTPWPESGAEGPLLLDSAETAGAVLLGPLLFSFVAWLLRHPTARHLDQLFFVSREGYFLKRLYDAVLQESGLAGMPRSRYFHCSRRAALGALQGRGLDVDAVLSGAGYRGSLAGFLLARLGFAADPSLGYERVPIALPRDNDLVRSVMELMRQPIEAHGRTMAEGLAAYAGSVGMRDGTHGFVDVGYSGTMQSVLQQMLGVRLVGLYMGVSREAAQVRGDGGHAFGAFADGDVSGFTGGYGQMLEAFLTAPHGQTVGYDLDQSPPVPVFRHGGYSQTVFATLERFYDGAEDYALQLLRCWGPEVLQLPFPAEAATAMLAAVRSGRLRLDDALAATLSLEDDFCGNGEIKVFRAAFEAGQGSATGTAA